MIVNNTCKHNISHPYPKKTNNRTILQGIFLTNTDVLTTHRHQFPSYGPNYSKNNANVLAIILVGPAEQLVPQGEDLGPVEVVEP